jgi:hypothetical protein
MAAILLEAAEGLNISGQREGVLGKDLESIDEILPEQRPRKQKSQKTLEEVKKELTKEFLTPPASFGQEWLNKLQQYVLYLNRGCQDWIKCHINLIQ